jgi:hypothetical protein
MVRTIAIRTTSPAVSRPSSIFRSGLPSNGKPYYEPTENGVEAKIKARLGRLWGAVSDEEEPASTVSGGE